MLVVGLALFLTMLVPTDEDGGGPYIGVIIGLSMLGKLAITSSYGVVYIFSTEQFPTQVTLQYESTLFPIELFSIVGSQCGNRRLLNVGQDRRDLVPLYKPAAGLLEVRKILPD